MLHSTKTYGHSLGLSACFRQWRAESHCKQLHGYALAFKFEFEANSLDKNGWVVDFGALKQVKEMLCRTFDHKLCVALDDPQLETFRDLQNRGIADVVIFNDGVGCEAFAKFAYQQTVGIVTGLTNGRVSVVSCECREHEANSAIYLPPRN